MAKTTEMVEVTLSLLKPYERNAKNHPAEQIEKIKKSILEFGFISPCLIDEQKRIIAGHGRVEAAKQLGFETVPCVYVEGLSEEQRRAYIIADNRLTELGGWDMDLVFEELEELEDMGFDIELTGFELPEDNVEVVEDDYDEDAVSGEPITKLGDLWQLGEHKLICGDSTDPEVFSTLMSGMSAEMSFTSPPYNVGDNALLSGTKHMQKTKYLHSEDDNVNYKQLLTQSTKNMLDSSGWVFINLQMLAGNKIALCEWLNHYKDVLCDIAIWYKTITQPAMGYKVMNSQFEFIFIFNKDNNSRAVGTKHFRGTVSNVYEGLPQRSREFSDIHSATFPIEFVTHFITNFTNSQECVLDAFGGTGTTLIACEQLDRKCRMIELDPHYCDVIIQRWENLTGKKAVLING